MDSNRYDNESDFQATGAGLHARDCRVNLIDTFLIVRIGSSAEPAHEFSIQFQPQMGAPTHPNTLLEAENELRG